MSDLERYSKPAHGALQNGPVDNLQIETETGVHCPDCARELEGIEAQEGSCHSGQFGTAVTTSYLYCNDDVGGCGQIWMAAA